MNKDEKPSPLFLVPGMLVRQSDRDLHDLPLFDDPRMTGKMSARPIRWAPKNTLLLVLAVLGEGNHVRALVLYGEGHTGWCWGGYLEPEGT
jgi:hypothetical protein